MKTQQEIKKEECENNIHEWSKPFGEYSISVFKNCLKCGKENPRWEMMTQNGVGGSAPKRSLEPN